MTGGQKGVADIPVFAGIGLMGGAMLRDFAIVATAFEVDVVEARKAGLLGVLSLGLGTILPFIVGVVVALAFGYTDAVSVTTIGAGAITYIVGPVTGAALGADSAVLVWEADDRVDPATLAAIGKRVQDAAQVAKGSGSLVGEPSPAIPSAGRRGAPTAAARPRRATSSPASTRTCRSWTPAPAAPR